MKRSGLVTNTQGPEVHAKVDKLNLFYGKRQVLFDINALVMKQQVISLLGPSGCGKSTLLRCFNRMNDYVDACKVVGSIMIDGVDIYSDDSDVVLLRSKVGMVFQKPNPFPGSIYYNVAYGPTIQGIVGKVMSRKARLDEIVEKSLVKVGLWNDVKDRLNENAYALSGGQQQRLCIARAIAVQPSMLLMDEPCSALDPVATAKIGDLIVELKKKYTIIMVTHSVQHALSLSDRLLFLQDGAVLSSGTVDEVINSDSTSSYVRQYLEGK